MQIPAARSSVSNRTLSAALCVPIAIWAGWAAATQQIALDGVLLSGIAAILFVGSVLPENYLIRTLPLPRAVPSVDAIPWTRVRAPLQVSVVCAALTWLFSGGNKFRPETVFFCLLAVGLYLLAFWDRSGGARPVLADRLRGLVSSRIHLSWSAVGLLLVLAIAAFFRYYQIGSVPAEPTSDHAEKLLDIRDILNGQYRIFFPRNTGREPLQFYFALPFVKLVGLNHLALKLEEATFSLIAIPFMYLLGKEIAGAKFGLLSAFFLAVSFWDVAIARVGLRFPLNPLFVCIALLFLIRALRYNRRNDYLLCGVATGVGLYGYSPFRAMVLLIGLALVVKIAIELRSGSGIVGSVVRNGLLCGGAILMVMLPLAHYMTENPQMFWFRALSRVSGAESPLPSNPLQVLWGNVVNGLLMFNWRGDVVWVNTIPGQPSLDFVSGGLFVLGIVWCLHELLVRREPVAGYLLLAFAVFMLPSILSLSFPQENPSVVRAGGETPIVALLAAAPLYLTWRRLDEWTSAGSQRVLIAATVVVLLALMARVNFDRYFHDYEVQYRQSARNSTEIAETINAFTSSVGSRQNAFIKAWPHWVDTRNVAFNLGDPSWDNVLGSPDEIRLRPFPPGNKLVILNRADADGLNQLRSRFPQGQVKQHPSATAGQEYVLYFIPEGQ